MKFIKLTLAILLSVAFTPLAAQDLGKGYAAYLAGNYAVAIKEWGKPIFKLVKED
jgi:hypothetical protein